MVRRKSYARKYTRSRRRTYRRSAMSYKKYGKYRRSRYQRMKMKRSGRVLYRQDWMLPNVLNNQQYAPYVDMVESLLAQKLACVRATSNEAAHQLAGVGYTSDDIAAIYRRACNEDRVDMDIYALRGIKITSRGPTSQFYSILNKKDGQGFLTKTKYGKIKTYVKVGGKSGVTELDPFKFFMILSTNGNLVGIKFYLKRITAGKNVVIPNAGQLQQRMTGTTARSGSSGGGGSSMPKFGAYKPSPSPSTGMQLDKPLPTPNISLTTTFMSYSAYKMNTLAPGDRTEFERRYNLGNVEYQSVYTGGETLIEGYGSADMNRQAYAKQIMTKYHISA